MPKTTNAVAVQIGVHKTTLYRWLNAGDIPSFCYHRSGQGPYRFREDAVEFFSKRMRWPKNEGELNRWNTERSVHAA